MYRSIARVIQRVVATPAAEELIDRLRAEYGAILFFQPGACCDGSSPIVYLNGDFLLDPEDVYLGHLAGVPFYISSEQFSYWQDNQLVVDVIDGAGALASLEHASGKCFITRCRELAAPDSDLLSAPGLAGGEPIGI